jgi:signal transduction histidine kinase
MDETGGCWFATVQGLVTIHPDEIKPPRLPPRTVLEKAFVDRRPVGVYSSVEVQRGDGELEFQFAAVSLMDSSDIRFRYRLDGFDEAWREVGPQQIAGYTNVPPGHYRFRVAASHGSGSWAEDEAVLEVALAPRFYQTNIFLAAVILGSLLAAGSGYTLWTRQVRARRRRLEALVAERTSSLKKATRQLEGLTRRQSDFVSGISHELKTPLTLIRLYAETLLENVGSPQEKRVSFSRIIVREVERLTRLVDRVLDFSRIEHGVKRYKLEEGDLSCTVAETAGAYEPYLLEEGFTIRLDVEPAVPMVRFDADAISMAIINLLENAAKYSGESTTIDLRVYSRGSSVIIEVQDRGIGIATVEQARIFERFYRVSSDPGSGDYGIGLFVVQDVVSAHDRRVEVDSGPGRGSTFRLVFPTVGIAAEADGRESIRRQRVST